ncbi:MAG: hypothetical protein AAGA30_14145, partial [Planctomycetota bacterium]
ALSITLDSPIKLTQSASQQPSRPKIEKLILLERLPDGEVRFQSNLNPDQTLRTPAQMITAERDISGNLTEKLLLESPKALIDQTRNQLIADGPGAVQIYRKSNAKNAAPGLEIIGSSTNPVTGLTYVHTKFQKQLLAHLETNELSIFGNLRSVYANVPDAKQAYDPDNNIPLPAGAVRLYCDRIDFIRATNPLSPKPQSEFVATGSVKVFSQNFESDSDRISFRNDTEILKVEGKNGRNIWLTSRSQPGAPWQKFTGKGFDYNVRTKTAAGNNVNRISAAFNKRP